MVLLGLIALVPLSATPELCARMPLSAELRNTLARLPERRDDADLLREFVRLEPKLGWWAFIEIAHRLPDDACTRRLLGPMAERRARTCTGDECLLLNGIIFRSDLTRAIERDVSLTHDFPYAIRATSDGDGGLRIQVTSSEDGGLTIHNDVTRADPAAEVMLARGTMELPLIDGDTPTTFGAAGALTVWRSRDLIPPGAALVACTNGTLKPLGRFLGIRAVWQFFPEGWTRQFEYQLPCAATFVVPASAGIRPGTWRAFPIAAPRGLDDMDPGPPYVNGTRVRRFGPVTYRETVRTDSTQATIYGKRCLIEATVGGTRRSTELHSSYGCQLEFAADLNADGLADFVVHMGGESCEHSFLFLSGEEGWADFGSEGSCE